MSWEFDYLAPGTYDVYASWDGYKSLGTGDVGGLGKFRTSVWTAPKLAEAKAVSDADFSLDPTADRTDLGTTWQRIAYQITVNQHGEKIIVDLGTADAEVHPDHTGVDRHYIIADAVRVIRTDALNDVTTYEYDHRNRLIQVTDYADAAQAQDRQTVNYTYDVLGRRMAVEVDEAGGSANDYTEVYTYNGSNVAVINRDNVSGADTRQHLLWSPVDGSLLAFEQITDIATGARLQTSWALQDQAGRVRDLIGRKDAASASVLHTTYTFGVGGRPHAEPWAWNASDRASLSTELLFFERGLIYDTASDLVFTGGAFVDPHTDQWISQVGTSGGGSNPYRYLGNAGVGRTSPADAVAGLGDILARPALAEPDTTEVYLSYIGAAVQATAGIVEVGVGGFLVATGAGAPLGIALIANGIDDAQSGLRTVFGDEPARSGKFALAAGGAELLGASEGTQEAIGTLADIYVGGGLGGAAAAGKAVSTAGRAARSAGQSINARALDVMSRTPDELAARANKAAGLRFARSEARYGKMIRELESQYGSPKVHSLEKHGAQTSLHSQLSRVKEAHYPNPSTGLAGNKTKNASKFITNKDHYYAIRYAINKKLAGESSNTIQVRFPNFNGITVKNFGTHSSRGPFGFGLTMDAVVRFDDSGRLITAYPGIK